MTTNNQNAKNKLIGLITDLIDANFELNESTWLEQVSKFEAARVTVCPLPPKVQVLRGHLLSNDINGIDTVSIPEEEIDMLLSEGVTFWGLGNCTYCLVVPTSTDSARVLTYIDTGYTRKIINIHNVINGAVRGGLLSVAIDYDAAYKHLNTTADAMIAKRNEQDCSNDDLEAAKEQGLVELECDPRDMDYRTP